MLKGGGGGHNKFGVVFTQKLEVLGILKGGWVQKVSTLLKEGTQQVLPSPYLMTGP